MSRNFKNIVLDFTELPTAGFLGTAVSASVKTALFIMIPTLKEYASPTKLFSPNAALLNLPSILLAGATFFLTTSGFEYLIKKAENSNSHEQLKNEAENESSPSARQQVAKLFLILTAFSLITYMTEYAALLGEKNNTAKVTSHFWPAILTAMVFISGLSYINGERIPERKMFAITAQLMTFNNMELIIETLYKEFPTMRGNSMLEQILLAPGILTATTLVAQGLGIAANVAFSYGKAAGSYLYNAYNGFWTKTEEEKEATDSLIQNAASIETGDEENPKTLDNEKPNDTEAVLTLPESSTADTNTQEEEIPSNTTRGLSLGGKEEA